MGEPAGRETVEATSMAFGIISMAVLEAAGDALAGMVHLDDCMRAGVA